MKKLLVATMTVLGLCSSAFAEDAAIPPAQKTNRFGADVTFNESDPAYGIIYEHDFSLRDRVFIQIEYFEFDDKTHTSTNDYYQTEVIEGKGAEFELGYLRRLSDTTHRFGFYIGPSVSLQLDESELNGTRDYGVYGTETAHADIETDLGINVYANVMADYTFLSGFGLFTMFSYGYQFERDGTAEYAAGAVVNYTTEADTFWNASVGVFFSF